MMSPKALAISCVVVLNLMVDVSATIFVNLTQAWEHSPLYNKNKAYCTVQRSMEAGALEGVVGYVVLKNGVIFAEGYNDDYDPAGTYEAWSTTKSWSSMLIGYLVGRGSLDTSWTLGEIFADDADWIGVNDAEEKKSIVLRDVLRMSAGLSDAASPFDGDGDVGDWNATQETFVGVMNSMNQTEDCRGRFRYLALNHVLSRVVLEVSGSTPAELAAGESGIFASLGVDHRGDGDAADLGWDTFGGVEGSAYGLRTNPRTQAKLGQLYLQNGRANADADEPPLIDPEWVRTSTTNQLDDGAVAFHPYFGGYGYQWWTDVVADRGGGGGSLLLPELEGMYGALGYGGQFVVVVPRANVVISVMGDLADTASDALLRLVLRSLDALEKEVDDGCAASSAGTLGSFLDGALSSASEILFFATILFKTAFEVLFVR